MNTTISGNDPAFPLQCIGPEFSPGHCGMSLKDFFAAQALPALIANLGHTKAAGWEMKKLGLEQGEFDKLVAKCAYDYAESMIRERNKR